MLLDIIYLIWNIFKSLWDNHKGFYKKHINNKIKNSKILKQKYFSLKNLIKKNSIPTFLLISF